MASYMIPSPVNDPIIRGVRQGCPLSIQSYIIAVDLLANFIDKD